MKPSMKISSKEIEALKGDKKGILLKKSDSKQKLVDKAKAWNEFEDNPNLKL